MKVLSRYEGSLKSETHRATVLAQLIPLYQ